MLRKTLLLTSAMLICTAATLVRAGYTQQYEVVLNETYDYAYGTMHTVRNSADSTQYLYCRVSDRNDFISGASGPRVTCYARDASGTTRSCTSWDPQQVEIASGISDASYVYFTWADTGIFGTFCEDLQVRNGSSYME